MFLPRSGPICASGQSSSLIRWQCVVSHRETTRRNPGSMYERTSSRCAAAIRQVASFSTNQVDDIQGSYLPLLHDHLCERQRDPPIYSQTSATGEVLHLSRRGFSGRCRLHDRDLVTGVRIGPSECLWIEHRSGVSLCSASSALWRMHPASVNMVG
jgi:hypothetical protein